MNFNLSEEQQLIQKTARDFANDHLRPGVIDRDENAQFPAEQVKMMGELGFMGMMVDSKWNGEGLDTVSYSVAMEEISRIDASASVIMSVNNSLVCSLLSKFGNKFQKEKYLSRSYTERNEYK